MISGFVFVKFVDFRTGTPGQDAVSTNAESLSIEGRSVVYLVNYIIMLSILVFVLVIALQFLKRKSQRSEI